MDGRDGSTTLARMAQRIGTLVLVAVFVAIAVLSSYAVWRLMRDRD